MSSGDTFRTTHKKETLILEGTALRSVHFCLAALSLLFSAGGKKEPLLLIYGQEPQELEPGPGPGPDLYSAL